MIIVETCPNCGHPLTSLCLTSYPPQYVLECINCNWRSKPKQDTIVYKEYKEEPEFEKVEDDINVPVNKLNITADKDTVTLMQEINVTVPNKNDTSIDPSILEETFNRR